MGFVKNSEIKALFVSPTDNATAYKISCSVIAMRKEDARNIIVGADDAVRPQTIDISNGRTGSSAPTRGI